MDETAWAFFLSHAHADRNKDGILKKFFNELNAAVARHLELEQSRTGFLDTTGIPVGKDWSAQLGGALRNSKVLICLMSEAFLGAPNCGRELHVFLRRREILAKDGSNPSVIFPLWWDRNRVKIDLPKTLSQYQWSDDDFPEGYKKKGIRSLLINGDTAGYETLIRALVVKISQARDEDLPAIDAGDLPEFSLLENALAPATSADAPISHRAQVQVMEMPDPDVPYEVNFVYVAPKAQELPPQRKNRDAYNEMGAWFWEAYRPKTRDRIGPIVKLVSAQYKSHDFATDDPQIVKYLESATFDKDQLAVLIVDPFATIQPECRELLSQLDRSGVVNYGVVTVWNEDDEELAANRDLLEGSLRLAFPRSYSVDGLSFCRNTRTRDEFAASLGSLLERLMEMAMERRKDKVRIDGPRLAALNLPPRYVA
jgi:FxsC-like protein